MEVRLLAISHFLYGEGSPEGLIEHAGRVCYRSKSKGDPSSFIRKRIREGHESIIEHAVATFEIKGISRACSHQLVRHRLASYSQESQRYVRLDKPDYITPPSIAANPEALAKYREFMEKAWSYYRELMEMGIPKQDARFVLPNATATRIVMSANFREWRHFIKVRLDPRAQWEIRELARRILSILYRVAPSIFADLAQEAGIEG
ncbi:MAG: FAD-dependent thymidylate synthase [Chloroflexi bacterium]|nr:MAG: FAD-dependent thymidylate synthase [Chloroflexota bacterium]HDN78921.1 FAD-dependent thymidylate synthase [Chloroflexota bacterium]